MKKTQKLIFAVVTMVLSLFLLTACGLQTHMHDYSERGYNDENHWMYCAEDNVKNDETVEAHTFTERGTDEDYHWMYCPTCGAVQQSSKAAHVDEDLDGKCDVCEYKVPVYASFAGQVTLRKGGSAAVSTNEGVTITVSDDDGEAELKNFVFNEDGTFSFTAEEGEYTLEVSKDGYMDFQGVIAIDHEAEVTGYEVELGYKLLQVALKPNYDPNLHDLSNMNEDEPYVMHTYSGGNGKTLDVETVLPQNNAMFTWYAGKGHAVANGDRVGVWVKFYDESMSKSEFVWFQTIGDNYRYAVYNGGMWSTAVNLMQNKSTYSADMSAAEKAQFDKGELKITLGRSANYIFVIVNDELRDTIVLDEKYATMDAYLGLVGWDVSSEDAQNKFYFALEDLNMGKLTLNVTGENSDKLIVNGYKESYDFGDNTDLTFAVQSGYYIDALKINGKAFDKSESYSVNLFNKDATLDIEVTISELDLSEITFEPQWKYLFQTEYTALSDGVKAVFNNTTTKRTFNGTVQNGKLVVELEDGDYTVSVNDYRDATVTVKNGVGTELKLDRNILDAKDMTSGAYTITESGDSATIEVNAKTSGYAVLSYPFEQNGKYTVTATITAPFTAKRDFDFRISLLNDAYLNDGHDPTEYFVNIGRWDDYVYVKLQNSNKTQVNCNWANNLKDGFITFKIKLTFNGSTVSMETSYQQADGTYATLTTQTVTNEYDFTYIGFKSLSACTWSDISIDEAPKYTVSVPTAENVTVTADSKYCYYGNSVVYTITPDEGYVVSSVKVNGVEKIDKMDGDKLTVTNYKPDTEIEIQTEVEQELTITVNAPETIEGCTVVLEKGGETYTVKIENGTASFVGMTGIYTATLQGYYGLTFDVLDTIIVRIDGEMDLTDLKINNLTYDNKTYPKNDAHKATSVFNVATGEGTATSLVSSDGKGMFRHVTLTSYDDVAITVYMDYDQLSSAKEESGALIFFGSEYVLFGQKDQSAKELSWQTNNWHDANDSGNVASGSVSSITKDSTKCTNYLYRSAAMTDAEFELYKQGRLPITLVRQGNNIYVFVNGEYAAYSLLNEKYADMKVQVGLSALGLVSNASYDFKVETDISAYLAKCTGATDFTVEITGEGTENFVVNGLTEDGVYNMNQDYKFTFTNQDGYVIRSLKVNGATADYTKAIEYRFVQKTGNGTLKLEVVVEEAGMTDITVTVPAVLNGAQLSLVLNENSYDLTVENEQVTFRGMPGLYDAHITVTYMGKTYEIETTVVVAVDGTAQINEAVVDGYFGTECITYFNDTSLYATSTYDLVSGEGTLSVSGATVRHKTLNEYTGNVAITMYMDTATCGTEAAGPIMVFVDQEKKEADEEFYWEYVWVSLSGKNVSWNTNVWHDKSDTTSTRKALNITPGATKCLMASTLGEPESTIYENGTLPLTIVRNGAYVYAFLNGNYIGYSKLDDAYASKNVSVGLSVLGVRGQRTYNYKIETDVSAYLDKITAMQAQNLIANGVDTAKYTISEDENGAKVVFTAASSAGKAILNNPYAYGEKFVLEATYCGNTKLNHNEAFEDRIRFIGSDGSDLGYLLNIGTWHNDTYYVKWYNDNDLTHTVTDYMVNNLYTVKLKVTFEGANISTAISLLQADGTYTDWMEKSFTTDRNYATVAFSSGWACTWSDIKVYKA